MLLLLVMGLTGCSGMMSQSNYKNSGQYTNMRGRIVDSPWWEHGGIDIDWPY